MKCKLQCLECPFYDCIADEELNILKNAEELYLSKVEPRKRKRKDEQKGQKSI